MRFILTLLLEYLKIFNNFQINFAQDNKGIISNFELFYIYISILAYFSYY